MKTSKLFASTNLALVLAGSALGAQAQALKAGLWEVSNKVGGSPEIDKAMAQLQAQLAAMPAAQRKMMEDTLAQRGMASPGVAAGGMATKMCVSKEMAANSELPMQQRGNCTTTTSDKTASGMKMKFVCTNPASSGEGQWSFNGDSAYSMKMQVTSAAQGAPKTTTIDSTGKWLDSDCGAVKPAR